MEEDLQLLELNLWEDDDIQEQEQEHSCFERDY